jgi:glycosyltransferase involved in cell wall biosynthesis
MRGIIRFALAKTSRAIVLGNCLSSVFEGILPNERVRVVPNGLEDRFTSAMNSASKDRRSAVMLFLSTLMEEKGTLDVLKALPAITERVPRVRVVFAGKWYRDSDRQTAEQLVRDLRLESHVEFVGAVAGSFKYDLIRNSSFLLFPTKYPFEGHPFVILEAMSAGIPVISTRWACIPEMLEDAVNGFLIEPGDVRGIAEKSVQLLTDEGLCHRMGEANRERFLRQFLFERFAERIQGVFAEVLERQPIAGELEREVESV